MNLFQDKIYELEEKKLTQAELDKREEIAKAIEKDQPEMPMDKKMAIATATAKKVAEEVELEEGTQQTLRKYVPGYAKRQIDKKMDAGKFGRTDADKDANYWRYKKIQDKLTKEEVELEEGWKEKVAAGLTAAVMATNASGVVLNPARPIGPKGQTVANPYPSKTTKKPSEIAVDSEQKKNHHKRPTNEQKSEVEHIEEMTQGKSYTQAQLQKKIQSGSWEATQDIKPGKHVEMRHHTGKRVTVHVKESIEDLEEGKIQDINDKLTAHAQRKIDHEAKYGKMNAADLHSHETVRKQLLAKKAKLTSAKMRAESIEESAKLVQKNLVDQEKKYGHAVNIYHHDPEGMYVVKHMAGSSKVKDIHRGNNLELAKSAAERHLKKLRECVSYIEESNVVRKQNGRTMVSAEAAIKLAREIAAKRKEGSKASHDDLKTAVKKITKEEVEIEENHLKQGTKLKKGKEEVTVVKPVDDDHYLVKEKEPKESKD